MNHQNIYTVIMAGGQGTRLWPQSRFKQPKQLWKILHGNSMLQDTVERVSPLIPPEKVLIITGEHLYEPVRAQLPNVPVQNILVEPMGKNTAPCVGLAALYITDPDAYMVVLASDHIIRQSQEFIRLLTVALEIASQEGHLVTFGIKPTGPETGFGYIQRGEQIGPEVYSVKQFTEKPDSATAQHFVASGEYYWNSGMFVWKISTLMAMIERHLPHLHQGLMRIKAALGTPDERRVVVEAFETFDSISIDYGIMEKAENTYVVPADFGWDDVGSWAALPDVWGADDDGNTFQGQIAALDTHESIAYSDDGLIALIGVEDMIVVKVGNAVLVCSRKQAQKVRSIVDLLKEKGLSEYV